MKNYICLNHGECHWADEVPPREFPLVDGEVNCPNCNSANIREMVPEQNKLKRLLPLIAGVILILALSAYFWLGDSNPPVVIESTKPPTSDGPSKPISPSIGSNDTTKGNSTVIPPPDPSAGSKSKPKVTYHKVVGSEFCVDDCVLEYTEQDNLGHTRVRRINNYDKCCPADK